MPDKTVAHDTRESLKDEMERRQLCLAAESQLIRFGNHEGSLSEAFRRIVCAGQYVNQNEGGSLQPERALLRWAALTTKAISIAISRSAPGDDDEHDLVLYDHEASVALAGLSEVLTAAPRLIAAFDGITIRSPRHSTPPDEIDHGEEAEGDEGGAS